MNIMCASGDLVRFAFPMPGDRDEALAGQQVLRGSLLLGKSTTFAICGSLNRSTVEYVAIRGEDCRCAAARMFNNTEVTGDAILSANAVMLRLYFEMTHIDFLFGCTLHERVLSSSTLTHRTM